MNGYDKRRCLEKKRKGERWSSIPFKDRQNTNSLSV